jgi:hypothetical protein
MVGCDKLTATKTHRSNRLCPDTRDGCVIPCGQV